MKTYYKLTLAAGLLLAFMLPTNAKEESPSYNIQRAFEEIEKGDSNKAIEYLNSEIKENSKNGQAHSLLAALLLDKKQYGDAKNSINLAFKNLHKKDKEWRAYTHEINSELLAKEHDTIGAYSELAKSIQLTPTNELLYEERAQLYFEQQRYDESNADYQKILELNPGGVMGHMGLGRNAFYQKDYATAIEHYNKIILLHSDYTQGYAYRAKVYLAQKDYLKAINDICTALEIGYDETAYFLLYEFPNDKTPLIISKLNALAVKYPHNYSYYYYAGSIYFDKLMFEKAIENLKNAYDISANYYLLEGIADCYSELGHFENAIKYIQRARQMDPNNNLLLLKHASFLGESGNFVEAKKLYTEYIAIMPDSYEGYYHRAFLEDNYNQTDDALADYEMSIMLNPSYAYSYLGKGDMLDRLGRKEEAQEAYKAVIKLDTIPNNESCAMYALLYLGKQKEAIDFMNQVIDNDSTYSGNYYDGACLYSRMGETVKSLDYIEQALEKGFRRFNHLMTDDDLIPIRTLPEFEKLIEKYKKTTEIEIEEVTEIEALDSISVAGDSICCKRVEIPFVPVDGVTEVNCKINQLPLKFIFDTGASTVTLSLVEANFMMKNGYIKKSDVVGSKYFYDANGDISEGTLINLQEIDIDGLKLKNVQAIVVRNQKAPLLLGQSVLSRLGYIEIDNNNKKLVITH